MRRMLERLGRVLGWAGDICWDGAEWCALKARRMSPIANMIASMLIAILGALLACVVVAGLLA